MRTTDVDAEGHPFVSWRPLWRKLMKDIPLRPRKDIAVTTFREPLKNLGHPKRHPQFLGT